MSPYRSSTDERAPSHPVIPITPPTSSAEAPAPATWAAQYAHSLPTLIASLGGATSLSVRVPPPGSTDAMELTWTLAGTAGNGDTMPTGPADPAGRNSPSHEVLSSAAASSSSLVSLLLTSRSPASISSSPTSRIQGLVHALPDEGHGSGPSRRRAPSATATVTPLRRHPTRERRLPLRLQETDAIEAMGRMLPRSSARVAGRSRTFEKAKHGSREKRGRRGRKRSERPGRRRTADG